jgi:hypothetical protein
MSELSRIVKFCWLFEAKCQPRIEEFGPPSLSSRRDRDRVLLFRSLRNRFACHVPIPQITSTSSKAPRLYDACISLTNRLKMIGAWDQATAAHLLVSAFTTMGLLPSMGRDPIFDLHLDCRQPTRIRSCAHRRIQSLCRLRKHRLTLRSLIELD